MSKKTRIIVLTVLSIYLIIQFIPVDRTNPEFDPALKISAPPQVMSVLQKSCFDCHSNETKWPSYSYLAPVSWFIADDVSEGRRHLNFSEWGKLTPEKQDRKKKHIWDEVEEDEMPLKAYVYIHGEAKLTDDEKRLLKDWTHGLLPDLLQDKTE